MASYIPDGWILDGYIAPIKCAVTRRDLFEPLTFRYRPMTRREGDALNIKVRNAASQTNPEAGLEAEEIAAKITAERIVEWDLKAGGVHPIPVSADALLRMQSDLFERLYNIVRNREVSDIPPKSEVPLPSDDDFLGNSSAASGS